jgi:hypothetical protein
MKGRKERRETKEIRHMGGEEGKGRSGIHMSNETSTKTKHDTSLQIEIFDERTKRKKA